MAMVLLGWLGLHVAGAIAFWGLSRASCVLVDDRHRPISAPSTPPVAVEGELTRRIAAASPR